jgi:hypothetical protein
MDTKAEGNASGERMDTLKLPPSQLHKPEARAGRVLHRYGGKAPHPRMEEERPASAPPKANPGTEQRNVSPMPYGVGPPHISGRNRSHLTTHRVSSEAQTLSTSKGAGGGTSLDLMAHLQRSGASVVKTRTGSVLSRGFILKTDHYPSGSFPCSPFQSHFADRNLGQVALLTLT